MYMSMDMPESSKILRDNIISGVKGYERRRSRLYLLISAVGIPSSVWGIIASVLYVGGALNQSSFYQYFSLLFSDTDVVFSYWREFAFSVAESIPIIGLILVFIALTALLVSVRVFFMANTEYRLTLSFGK